MALRYWRGGAGTWNSSNTANWSTTSGGAGGASVPGSADDVIFNSASGPGGANTNYTCFFTAGYAPTINSLNISPPGTTATLTFGNDSNPGSAIVIIAGFTVAATRVSFSRWLGQWVFFGTQTINTNNAYVGPDFGTGGSGTYLNRGTLTWSSAWNSGGLFYVGPQTGGGNLVLNFSNIQHRNIGTLAFINGSTQTITCNWGGSSGRFIISSRNSNDDFCFVGNSSGIGDIIETNLTPGTNGWCLGGDREGYIVGTSGNTLASKYPTLTVISDVVTGFNVKLGRDTWGAPLWVGNLAFGASWNGALINDTSSQVVVNYAGTSLVFNTVMAFNSTAANVLQFTFQNSSGATNTFNANNRILNGPMMLTGTSFSGTLNVSNVAGGRTTSGGSINPRGGWTFNATACTVNFASTVIYTETNPCNTFIQNAGTINFNGSVIVTPVTGSGVAAPGITLSGGTANLNTGVFYLRGNWSCAAAVTLNAGTSTIFMSNQSWNATSANQLFTGGGKTYNLIVNTTASQTAGAAFNGGGLTFSGNNTIATLRIAEGFTTFVFNSRNNIHTKFDFATVTTINAIDTTYITGTDRAWWGTTSASGQHTINKTSGTINVSRLNIQQSTASGGATFNSFVGSGSVASNNNTNLSSNSGWQFTNIPAVSGFFNFF